jgi:hypothetical protein
VKAASAGDILLLQQQMHLLHPFVEPCAAFIQLHAEPGEFVWQEGTREADIQPAITERVRHCEFACNLQRIVEGGQHGAGDQARALRHLRRGGKEDQRVWAVAAIGVKIVLHRAHVVVAVFITQRDKLQRFLHAPTLPPARYRGRTGCRPAFPSPALCLDKRQC